jgi:hypothetical protein
VFRIVARDQFKNALGAAAASDFDVHMSGCVPSPSSSSVVKPAQSLSSHSISRCHCLCSFLAFLSLSPSLSRSISLSLALSRSFSLYLCASVLRRPSSPQCLCTSNGDGTYNCVIVPTSAGKHTLSVQLDVGNVQGSPFEVMVSPATANAQCCSAEGSGLEVFLVASPLILPPHSFSS